MRMIKTKIVATIGPASSAPTVLKRLLLAGVDVCRINFSHGAQDEHEQMLRRIRKASAELKRPVAVMADLCGPKIRVGEMPADGALLTKGSELTIQRRPVVGSNRRISTTLAELVDDIRVGHPVLLDDGKIKLKVIRRNPPRSFVCQVLAGGLLTSGKGVNVPKTALKLSALTEKDRRDARWIAREDFDYVALSFVQRAADVKALRRLLAAGDSEARIIAKIEKPKALRNIERILDAADGVMVARGDMGVEMSLPDVPVAQKRLAYQAAKAGKICIVATQMLESMTDSPSPTRAEVSDVANAVWDGADAVMLSGETAIGAYPEKAVRMMDRTVGRIEQFAEELRLKEALAPRGVALPATWRVPLPGELREIGLAVESLVEMKDIRAVVAFTMTGATAAALSKQRLPVPILALTPSPRVVQQTSLLYGVRGGLTTMCKHTREVLAAAAKEVRRLRWARKGQKIVVVSGRPLGESGSVNSLAVHTL
ncbi:MAG: pyruvate kinase [Planctomycetota bacterium]